MQDNNAITVASYNDNIHEYIQKDRDDTTRTKNYLPAIDMFLALLEPASTIFEIGSGTGSDALRIEKQGFRVTRSDIADEFVEYLQLQGFHTEHYDVLASPYSSQQSAIYSHAVLLHFTTAQFRTALGNIYDSLQPEGIFCFSLKLGDFEGYRQKGLSGKRYFRFWQVPELREEIAKTRFTLIDTFVPDDKGIVFVILQKV